MKRVFSFCFCLLLIGAFLLPVAALAQSNTTYQHSRVINVVYDDSGSMIGIGIDTWCKAKYALEVFAAMLEENDTMNVYVMSDFSSGSYMNKPPALTLYGRNGMAANVAAVHRMQTRAGNTPFDAVRKAYLDLTAATADEKWLVILTDGDFQGIDDKDAYFGQKNADIRVMFLGMGAGAGSIREDAANNIFNLHAETSAQILARVTEICTRIFSRNKIPDSDIIGNRFNIDVPMSELIVFAQGANVSLNGIRTASGNTVRSSAPVSVRYSEADSTTVSNALVDRNLAGVIESFTGDFDVGDYTIDITGADTVEVYYKPNIEIRAYLTDRGGNEVTHEDRLEAGDYSITFGFVKRGTDQRVAESRLLGEVTYEARASTNGADHGRLYGQNDSISVQEGVLQIDVVATYLRYHTVSTQLRYNVYRNKAITFTEISSPPYTLTPNGLYDNSAPIVVSARIDGRDITAQEWSGMSSLPVLTVADGVRLGEFTVEKTSQPGVYNIYPSLYNNDIKQTSQGDFRIAITYSERHGDETWSGSGEAGIHISAPEVRTLELHEVESPEYTLNPDGFENGDAPILVRATIDGRELTAQEWAEMTELPSVTLGSGARLGLRIEKAPEPGIYRLYPSLYEEDPGRTAYSDQPFSLSYEQLHGDEILSGKLDSIVRIKDGFGCIRRHLPLLIAIVSLLALVTAFILFMSMKVLPKKIQLEDGSNKFVIKPGRKGITSPEPSVYLDHKAKVVKIETPPNGTRGVGFSVTLAVVPVDRRYKPSAKRRVCVTAISNTGTVKKIEVASTTFIRHQESKRWVDEARIDNPPKKLEKICRNAQVDVEAEKSRLELNLKHL